MNKILLVGIILLSSCSSLKKSMIYSGATFGTAGAFAGIALSPDSYSKPHNAAIMGGLGALLGAGLAYYFWKDDPENKNLPSMILPTGEKTQSVGREDQIIIPRNSNKYQLRDLGVEVPENIKSKLPKAYVIEHVIPERVQKLNDGKSIVVDEHNAYEVSFE